MQRNVAGQIWIVYAYSRISGNPIAGDEANITAAIWHDGGSSAPLADTHPDELSGGFYKFDITQAESDAAHLLLTPVSTTANVLVVAVPGVIWTGPAGNLPANVVAWDGGSLPYIPGDAPGTLAIAAQIRAELSVELSRIDAAISSRLSSEGYEAPANNGIATILSRLSDTRAEYLDLLNYLDAAISSRLAADSPEIAAIKGKTDRIPDQPVDVEDIDDRLSETHGSGAWGPDVGRITKTYTLIDGAGQPVPGVECWASLDEHGQNRIGIIRTTNDLGQVDFAFNLPTGTHVWIWTRGSTVGDEEVI